MTPETKQGHPNGGLREISRDMTDCELGLGRLLGTLGADTLEESWQHGLPGWDLNVRIIMTGLPHLAQLVRGGRAKEGGRGTSGFP